MGRRATIRAAVGGAAVAGAAVTAIALPQAARAATPSVPPVSITTSGQVALTRGATVTIAPCWIVGSTDIRIPISETIPVPAIVGNLPPVSLTTTGQLRVNPANADHPAPSATVTIAPCWIVGSTDIRIPISETLPL
jgi:hypothetical protein